ncbi:GNAT family N-acetyltransferase [Schleiferilactobacillus perolens]|uniref:Acetyltransferase n=1 Tax=Schleiferilactobacillus perolens DSM 12744 TaxID=1423792 RepID=A0A0R1N453_9LACO|nr:GNAT family N-acetyltransferase [Schleiferilactobacillus perolens]KRL12549.1 acetyltransferase [Schleiferilactobacillus perolens DSM 12744]
MTNYRLTTAAEREQFYQLYLYAFNREDSAHRQHYFFERYDNGWAYGIKNGNKLGSGLYALPFNVNFHGVPFRMNGIGDVMSAPEFSGRGGAGTLLKASLQEMLEKHVTLAYLAPFSYEYYRRFGYEQVFDRMRYTLPGRQVPLFHPQHQTGTVQRLSLAEALPLIKPFYQTRTASFTGGVVREDWWWDHLVLQTRRDAAVYTDDQHQVQGYIIYTRDSQAMTVEEWYAATGGAWEHLMGFILRNGNSFAKLVFEDQNSRYQADWFPNPDSVTATVTPYMMARIVDLADFFTRYPYTGDTLAPVTLAVTDPVLPENQGTWSLGMAHGRIAVQKIGTELAEQADIHISIQQLVKAMFGTQSLSHIVFVGQATGNAAAVARLDALCQHDAPMLNDYF